MKILVTGGAGFIGSHLVDLLLISGHQVRVLDNLSTGDLGNLSLNQPHLSFIQGDIRDPAAIATAVEGIDAIVHLAAVASVQASVADPQGTHQVNLVGTLNLLEAARRTGIKRFVFASSAAVYGDVKTLPVAEDIPLAPLTPYAADKLSSEYYLDFYRRQHDLDPVIFRFFNIFGPRQDPSSPYSGVISIFLEHIFSGRSLNVYGDGCQSRDFVYVTDLVSLLRRAVEQEKISSRTMNVGNGKGTNLNQLIEYLQQISGKELTVNYLPPRLGDIRHSLADNSILCQQMNYACRFPVKEGLRLTYEWYLQQAKSS
jgi:UDP-glucose 4-epimerase